MLSVSHNPSVRVLPGRLPQLSGDYRAFPADVVPKGFSARCQTFGWDAEQMWAGLADHRVGFYENAQGAFIYRNAASGLWSVNDPSGAEGYVTRSDDQLPPTTGWQLWPGRSKNGEDVANWTLLEVRE